MHLYVSHPLDTIDGNMCVEEIGTCIVVQVTDTEDRDRLTIGSRQFFSKHPMLPNILQEGLCHLN